MSNLQDPQLLISKTIDGYRILDILREEPYAYVYLAENAQGAFWFYVLKSPDGRELSADRFRQSFFTVKPAQGSNLLSIHSFNKVSIPNVADDLLYVVYERATGTSLREYLSNHEVSYEQAILWTKALLNTLAQLHGQRIFHHGISLDNLWIDESFHIKIAELGISSVLKKKIQAFGASISFDDYMLLMRAPFVSPEEIKGKLANHSADLYSVAAVSYFLLSQQLPIIGENDEATLRLQIDAQPLAISEINPVLPDVLDAIFNTALAKDPKDRFVSAHSFSNALEGVPSRLDAALEDEDELGFSQNNLDQRTFLEYEDADEKTFFEEEEEESGTLNQVPTPAQLNAVIQQNTPIETTTDMETMMSAELDINDDAIENELNALKTTNQIMPPTHDDLQTKQLQSPASTPVPAFNKTLPLFGSTPNFPPPQQLQNNQQAPSFSLSPSHLEKPSEILELSDETNSGHLLEASMVLPIPQLMSSPSAESQVLAQSQLDYIQPANADFLSIPAPNPAVVIVKASASDWPGQQQAPVMIQEAPIATPKNKIIVQKSNKLNIKGLIISIAVVLGGVIAFGLLHQISHTPKPEKILFQSQPSQLDIYLNGATQGKTPFEYNYPEDFDQEGDVNFTFLPKSAQAVPKEIKVPQYPSLTSVYISAPKKNKELARFIIESNPTNAIVTLVEQPKAGSTNTVPTTIKLGYTPLVFFGEKGKELSFEIIETKEDPNVQGQVKKQMIKLTGMPNQKSMIEFQSP